MLVPKRLFLLPLLLCGLFATAQTDSIAPPYQRFPNVPSFRILLGDSTTFYTKESLPKKKPLLLMLFSPECSHCQQSAEEIVQNKEALKNIQIVLVTLHPLFQMNAFARTYGLKDLPNVVLGKDVHYLLPSFYGIHSLPNMAFYRKNGTLIRSVEGALPVEKVLQLFKAAD
jgi:thioredoxin-related protein